MYGVMKRINNKNKTTVRIEWIKEFYLRILENCRDFNDSRNNSWNNETLEVKMAKNKDEDRSMNNNEIFNPRMPAKSIVKKIIGILYELI